jgi:hypothetical protein
MLEAAAITELDYFREEEYDENTRDRVVDFLCKAGADRPFAQHAIEVLEDNGILFRERKQK